MRKLLLALFTILTLDIFLSNCANPTPPTGGAKDTIPPKLIHSIPNDQQLNFTSQTITLTFNEAVNTDKIKQNLIITPTIETNYKVLPKKETVTLKFETPFEDSTTYTLNFFAGITDITEKNPAENLVLAFSTTNYIDSLEIFGKITDLLTGKPKEKMTVGLYKAVDSLDLLSMKPTYFITTDESGAFRIQNIKQNPYILLAFMDENKNLLFNPSSEAYAFVGDTIKLARSLTDSLRLHSIAIDASPLNLISARPAGLYFEVRYSKPLTNYQVEFPDHSKGPASDFTGESQSIRFFNNLELTETDSIRTFITVYDSLKNNLTDTIFVKFRKSSRKPATYKASLNPSSGTLKENQKLQIKFSKPTRRISDTSFLYVPLDTLFDIYIEPKVGGFNFNHTDFSFYLPKNIKTIISDTLELLKAEFIQTDSLNFDTAQYIIYKQLERITPNSISINVKDDIFVSVEEDTARSISGSYKFPKPEDFGTIKITISTEEPSYLVQLMSKDKKVDELSNCSVCNFDQVPPGTYWVRILIDEDNNGKWSPGNFLEFKSPEPILHFTTESTLRSNWQIELNYTF